MHRSTLRHMLVAAFAASALLTSTAVAKPVDRVDRFASPTSSLAGTTESSLAPKQDLRGEHAQDAARFAAQAQIEHGQQVRKEAFLRRRPQDLRGEHARDAARVHVAPSRGNAVYWAYDYEARKPSPQPASAPAAKPHDTDTVWLVLGIAFGASAIFAGTALVIGRRSRIRIPA